MPAGAVFHPSCSWGLRRAIALLRKPAGIDRREAVETGPHYPPPQPKRKGAAAFSAASAAREQRIGQLKLFLYRGAEAATMAAASRGAAIILFPRRAEMV